MRPRTPRPRQAANDRGALTLSYVIIVPVLLLALSVITQTAMWYLARQAALAAARQGADAARALNAQPRDGPSAALSFARTAASGYLRSPAATNVGSNAQTIQIRVTGVVPSFVPGLVIHVSEVAQAPVERFSSP